MKSCRTILERAPEFVHRRFLGLLIAAYSLAAVCPGPGLTAKGWVVARVGEVVFTLPMLLLAGLLFNAGLGAATGELAAVARRPGAVLAGLAANLLVPLAFVALLGLGLRFWPNPDESRSLLIGLAVVAAMPVAGSSAAWAQNASGNVALSLGLVVGSTALSPVTTPLVFRAFGAVADDGCADVLQAMGGHETGLFLTACVAVPSAAGLLVRGAAGGRVARLKPGLKLANSVALLGLCYANAAVALPRVVAEPDWDYLALILGAAAGLCGAAFAAGWAVARALSVGEPERRSLLFGLGMSNNGTGMVLASGAFAALPWAAVPVLTYNLIQHVFAGGVGRWLGRSGSETASGAVSGLKSECIPKSVFSA
jgi:bile acid:Na+ symporter, BASS family